ncbi:hypothetical protein Clacol_004585 [Clathrus columnatus]|uniref:Uncharacterized protein n=1 Tax=Clathrus columnatus TaxID=1419009 RepID=A0AAV5ACB8_9AGAM|nr:hypothetical protein Clacol_004585 [Clathrus columnatus]
MTSQKIFSKLSQHISVGRLPTINSKRYIGKVEPIEIVMISFPLKSPSPSKVLGSLPDLAEEIVLSRLEDLAKAIEKHYSPGAIIKIPGSAEILEQSYKLAFDYQRELRRMCLELEYSHVQFIESLEIIGGKEGPLTETEYLDSVTEVLNYINSSQKLPTLESIDKQIATDSYFLSKYRGILRFLETDLSGTSMMTKGPSGNLPSKRKQDQMRRCIAKKMIIESIKFSEIVTQKYPDVIRFRVHPNDNAGPKYTFNMFETLSLRAPWHNTVRKDLQGQFTVGPLHSFASQPHEVVYSYGRPYYIRAVWG